MRKHPERWVPRFYLPGLRQTVCPPRDVNAAGQSQCSRNAAWESGLRHAVLRRRPGECQDAYAAAFARGERRVAGTNEQWWLGGLAFARTTVDRPACPRRADVRHEPIELLAQPRTLDRQRHAEFSTSSEAALVSAAPAVDLGTLDAVSSWVPCATFRTLRAISCVAALCCSTELAMLVAIPEIPPIVPPISMIARNRFLRRGLHTRDVGGVSRRWLSRSGSPATSPRRQPPRSRGRLSARARGLDGGVQRQELVCSAIAVISFDHVADLLRGARGACRSAHRSARPGAPRNRRLAGFPWRGGRSHRRTRTIPRSQTPPTACCWRPPRGAGDLARLRDFCVVLRGLGPGYRPRIWNCSADADTLEDDRADGGC